MTEAPPPRRLTIALVIEDVNMRGGQERVIGELAPRLAARHEVHLFCHTVADIPLDDITVHRVCAIRAPLGPRAMWFALASSLAARGGKYDVVLSQGGNTLAQNFALVHTCHRDRRRVRLDIERRWRLKSPLRRVWEAGRDALFAGLERRAVRRCRGRVIAISQDVKRYLMREYGLATGDIHVAPNGVDHERFRPNPTGLHRDRIRGELGLAGDDFVALFMGGLWFEKGLPSLLGALALTDHASHLVVVGSGDVERFGEMARESGVADRVHFVPHVTDPEAWYNMADCLVHAPAVEPFGLVMVEAAACGLPLLATRAGVALDLIEEGVSGFFIERDDPPGIAHGLDRLAADPDLRRSMSEKLRDRSLQFDWDRQAEQIEAVFLAGLERGL
jgi:UDP-glucose:(heptosyl)LPS alpha-1,3-glucosyltransferase